MENSRYETIKEGLVDAEDDEIFRIANDYVIVEKVGTRKVCGKLFPIQENVGEALEDIERSGLVALTGPAGAHARIVETMGIHSIWNEHIWNPFYLLTGVYNITDYHGRFGSKGAKVNVVAHGLGHPLSSSQRIKEALGTDYTRETDCWMGEIGSAQLSEGEEVALLEEEGTPIFAYEEFLEASQDPEFLKANPSYRIVRTQDVLAGTKHGSQPLRELYDNSSLLCYVGGRTPFTVRTLREEEQGGDLIYVVCSGEQSKPQGEGRIITQTGTIVQALVDITAQRAKINNYTQCKTELEVWLSEDEGGRLLTFDKYAFHDGPLHGKHTELIHNPRELMMVYLTPPIRWVSDARFVGVHDIKDKSVPAPSLEHKL